MPTRKNYSRDAKSAAHQWKLLAMRFIVIELLSFLVKGLTVVFFNVGAQSATPSDFYCSSFAHIKRNANPGYFWYLLRQEPGISFALVVKLAI